MSDIAIVWFGRLYSVDVEDGWRFDVAMSPDRGTLDRADCEKWTCKKGAYWIGPEFMIPEFRNWREEAEK